MCVSTHPDQCGRSSLQKALEIETCLNEMFEHHSENICTWRDEQFKSIFTENMAPMPKVPFINNFDDSFETYVKVY